MCGLQMGQKSLSYFESKVIVMMLLVLEETREKLNHLNAG